MNFKVTALIGAASLALMAGSASAGDLACLITKNNTNPFFVKMKEGAEAKAAELGLDFQAYAGEKDGDAAPQITAIENCVAAGAKGILITASNDSVIPALKDARSKGVLVIALDTPIGDAELGHLLGVRRDRHEVVRHRAVVAERGHADAALGRRHQRPAEPGRYHGVADRLALAGAQVVDACTAGIEEAALAHREPGAPGLMSEGCTSSCLLPKLRPFFRCPRPAAGELDDGRPGRDHAGAGR